MFVVRGVVPENEMQDINELRNITGAVFPIKSQSKYKNLVPIYTPSVIGVSKKSDLFFVLPGVPGEKDYLGQFLDSIYAKVYPYLITLEQQ
jgi:hypothetical protein